MIIIYSLVSNINIFLKTINLYICYTPDQWSKNLSTDFTLNNCLFGSVKLTKNADPDKYKYTGYDIGFDSRSEFLFTDGSIGEDAILFGADICSSMHIDKKNKYILILGEGATQGLDDTTLTPEDKYPINFTQSERRFVLSLHYDGGDSFLFVDATEIYQFKANDSEIKPYQLCSGNISKHFTIEKNRIKRKCKIFYC